MSDAERDALIGKLLDLVEAESAERPGPFVHAVPRDKVALMVRQVLDVYSCRQGSAASVYAMDRLDQTIGWKPVPVAKE